MQSNRNMQSKEAIRKHWAERLVELNKFDSKQEVMNAGNCCFACGFDHGYTERAHILPHFKGGSDKAGNLHLLCAECHRQSEMREGEEYWAWFKRQNIFTMMFRGVTLKEVKGVMDNE